MKLIIKIKDVEHTLEMSDAKELYNELDKIFGQKETVERVVHEYPWRWWPYWYEGSHTIADQPKITWTSGTGEITMSAIGE